MKCGEFQNKLERLKSDFEYAKRLIKDFERTGKEEEENIQWIIQNIENSASWFREKLTTSSEAEAREIMGQDLFVGTEIAEKIFGGMKPFERRIPFSRAELIQAKLEGKILLYRPGYSLRGPPMTIEGMITNIQFNDPNVNMEFFNGDHTFDFNRLLTEVRQENVGSDSIQNSSWNLITTSGQKRSFTDASSQGSLPSLTEAFYDLLASKKLTQKYSANSVHVSTEPKGKPGYYYRLMLKSKHRSNTLELYPDITQSGYYTCESREVD